MGLGLLSVGHSNRGKQSFAYSLNTHVLCFPEAGDAGEPEGGEEL